MPRRSRSPARPFFGAALVLLPLLTGCDRAADPVALVGPAPATPRAEEIGAGDGLDPALLRLLEEASPTGRRDFFLLPDSRRLELIPQDPRNPLTPAKVRLGRRLFHETALGTDNVLAMGRETYSCASCHHAQGGFQANLPQGMAEGGAGFGARGEGRSFLPDYDGEGRFPDCQPIRTPSAMNAAYQEVMLWNGQFGATGPNAGTEGQWTPGTPLESNLLGYQGLETQAHAGLAVHRQGSIATSRVAEIPAYREAFREAFPGEAEPVNRLNAALAIAAFERTLLASRAPFQEWLRGDRDALTGREKEGAVVFFGKGGCVACHTGPALSSMSFHALGMGDLDQAYDRGRVNLEPFGGTVPWAVRLGRGGFTGRPEDEFAFKTPQLYNLTDSPFYGHGASFPSVRGVVEYKNAAVPESPNVPAGRLSGRFVPLGLTEGEIADLVTFLEHALRDARLDRFPPPELPSGNCFPVNDPQGRMDLGCGGATPRLVAIGAE
jgi:cytochrome c peroxidase